MWNFDYNIWAHARICSIHGWVYTETGRCPGCHGFEDRAMRLLYRLIEEVRQ